MRLFFFPFAGGNSYSYRGLCERLPGFITPAPFELPGRGRRATEPLLTSMAGLLDDAWRSLRGSLSEPYALFGHSMGASLAHEFARRAAREGAPAPRHLFVSGRQAPSVPEKHRRWALPGPEFKAALLALGGCPPAVLESEELMNFFEPILRADFQAVETHAPRPGAPLDVPITALVGDRDHVALEEARLWRRETSREFELHCFGGGHFFILEHQQELAALVSSRLAAAGAGRAAPDPDPAAHAPAATSATHAAGGLRHPVDSH